LRKPQEQKLEKEVSSTLTPNNSKIVQNFKKMRKKLSILNLVLEIDAKNQQWSVEIKFKEGEKLYKYCTGSFNKSE